VDPWLDDFLRSRFGSDRGARLAQTLRRIRRPALLGTLRRTTPFSTIWGFDRGLPVDRFYIEQFLSQNTADITGRVLEVRDDRYTKRFGTRIERTDIIDIDSGNASATIVADLSGVDGLPADTFDCFILTQTLQFIYNHQRAVRNAWRMLRPGGILLATVPAVSRIYTKAGYHDFWRYTPASCSLLFEEVFGREQVSIRPYGNVLTEVAFLMGMAIEEISPRERSYIDPAHPVIVAVRAVKHT
jgi:SAM-dependent methyltransferase